MLFQNNCLEKRNRVIVKFKCRKQRQNVLFNRKKLKDKSSDITQLRFSGKLFISESMSHENHQLAYRYRQLKTAGKTQSTWFFNNTVNLKLTDNSPIHKISHIADIEKVLGILLFSISIEFVVNVNNIVAVIFWTKLDLINLTLIWFISFLIILKDLIGVST